MFDTIFDDLKVMIGKLLDQYGLDDAELTPDTAFHNDLGLESIDLVALGGMLADRYGPRVNLAEFLAELPIEEVIGLRLGMLADFVRDALDEKAGSAL
jgi:acyl carrier protein